MIELLERLLPILFLIFLGMVIKKINLLSDEVIAGLKTMIVKIALPVILFSSFATMKLEVSYLLLFLIIFIYCCLLYVLGELFSMLLPRVFRRNFTGGYFTGFEFGMIGVGLFGAIWGVDQLPVIMLIAFGHILFIWFFYVPLITHKSEGSFNLKTTLMGFLKTPTIIGIGMGLIFNLTGIYDGFGQTLLGSSIYITIGFIAPITSPLVLMVIGYAMNFDKVDMGEVWTYIIARWVLVLAIGVPMLALIKALVQPLDPIFDQAYYAFILLPAPYILPLFIKDQSESDFFSQLLVYSTLTSLIGYNILLWMSL